MIIVTINMTTITKNNKFHNYTRTTIPKEIFHRILSVLIWNS